MQKIVATLAMLAVLAFSTTQALAAGDDVAIRAAAHEGFGRIALEWPAPVDYEVVTAKDILTVKFARPFHAHVEALRGALAGYVVSAAIENGGKSFVAKLKRPVTVNAFIVRNTTVVLDLTPAAAPKTAPKPAEIKAAEPKPAVSKAAEPKHETKPAAETVRITASEKNGMRRVVFAWPRRTSYALDEKDDTGQLSFGAFGAIDAAALDKLLPGRNTKVETRDDATVVTFSNAGGKAKASRQGNAIVLEVARAAPQPAPVKPQADTAAQDVTPPPLPAAAVADAPDNAPQPDADVAAAAPPPPANVAVRFIPDDDGGTLRFDWPVATGAAVFRQGNATWVVFGLPTALDLADPQAQGQPVISAVAQVPAKDATVLRFEARAGLQPAVKRAGTAWLIDLKSQATAPDAPVSPEPHPEAAPAKVLLRLHQASAPVRLDDAELGSLMVVPVGELGRGVGTPWNLVDFRVMPSVQGVVLRPLVDDLALHVSDDAIEVTRPGGLELSSDADRLMGHRPDRAHILFDFIAWRGPKSVDYVDRRAALERAITTAPQATRSEARLALARFYFGNFFAAETLAVLDAIAHDDPQLMGEAPVRALKGASCLLTGDLKCAASELGQNTLDGEPEAVLWRASLARALGDDDAAAKGFLDSVSFLPIYPKALRDRFALEAAAAMLATDQTALARPIVDLVLRDKPTPPDAAMALFLDGMVALKNGRLDDALKRWDEVAAKNDPPSRAWALYSRATALLDAKRATRADTVKTLDALRFAWRGDRLEYTLLRNLGELQLAEGNDGGGLEALHQAVVNFPDETGVKDVAKEASDAFAAMFLGEHGGDLPPLKSLALYDQFHDLEPVGDRLDQIVKKLIDRLVAVDLLDRAGGLLEDQVTKRLAGADKARGATQLALLRLMDHQPALALKALDIDVGKDVPADLARQRLQLRARVLMELQRTADALALLNGDQSRDADRLRADIYWRARDWKNAARTLARLTGQAPVDGKIDADTARIVVSLAAALTLDEDQPSLARLRGAFGPALAASPFAGAFNVLAGGGAAGADTDPLAVAKQVAQIGDLQSFMNAYKDKLASGDKTSAVN